MKNKIDLSGIEAIIFDFGGVVCNIDFSLAWKAFEKLGFQDLEKHFSQFSQSSFFEEFETGLHTPQEFRNILFEISGQKFSDKEIDSAWNAMILDIPRERIELLKKLKEEYRIFLLSNTNQTHYDFYLANFQREYGYSTFDDLFEKAWFSHQIKLKKPGKEIFEFVLKKAKLTAKNTLFVEDTSINLIEPKNLGLKTYLLKSGETILDIFD